jgi:hypothetical protein
VPAIGRSVNLWSKYARYLCKFRHDLIQNIDNRFVTLCMCLCGLLAVGNMMNIILNICIVPNITNSAKTEMHTGAGLVR